MALGRGSAAHWYKLTCSTCATKFNQWVKFILIKLIMPIFVVVKNNGGLCATI